MAADSAQPYAEENAVAGKREQPMVQKSMDKLVGRALLWAIPSWVRPNHLTILRLVLIPVVLVLLYFAYRWWALGMFVVALATDSIDGAMARSRGQISTFGVYMDPIADKLLVAAILAWVGYKYLVVQIFLGFIALELVFTAVGVPLLLRSGKSQPSNFFGKAKMIVQSAALLLFLIAGILDLSRLLDASLYLLWLALALAVISGGKQVLDALRKRPRET
jgi:CDP-diacylglycerol--glycerol-3-phosphate 3-phosphatidyltransferase